MINRSTLALSTLALSTLALSALAAVAALAGCARHSEPDAATFTTAMNDYLARRGDLCLGKTAWPIDVTQHDMDVGARNAKQMPVLEKLGLTTSSVAEIEVDDEGTRHRMLVRRFDLTDAGRKFYLARETHAASGKPVSHDFCAARLSLDKVVSWNLQKDADGKVQRAVVSYTYRIDAAPWTQDAEAQKVFPVVANVVRGAGTAQLQEAFVPKAGGNSGEWIAVDLQGS